LNALYFQTLFLYSRLAYQMNCVQTSFAVTRYLLSLDPQRDVLGTLLLLDSYAIACHEPNWILTICNSTPSPVPIVHRIEDVEYYCELQELPNWAYSYALALYQTENEESKNANQALQTAIQRFPKIPQLLLDASPNASSTNRSCTMDWPSVLIPLSTQQPPQQHQQSVQQVLEFSTTVFVQRNCQIWTSTDATLQWLYNACQSVVKEKTSQETNETELKKDEEQVKKTELKVEETNENGRMYSTLALTRYLSLEKREFDMEIATVLPEDVVPLDPQLMEQLIRPPPGIRHGRRRRRVVLPQVAHAPPQLHAPSVTLLDPDLPMMELFWRSFLPWTRVRGVPAARANNRW